MKCIVTHCFGARADKRKTRSGLSMVWTAVKGQH